MNRDNSLLEKIDPYRQAVKAMWSVEHFGTTSSEANRLLNDLSDAFRKGIADAVARLHKVYKNKKMPMLPSDIMEEVYKEDGWF